MLELNVKVSVRHNLGKGASRRLRRQSLVPGVVYGNNESAVSVEIGQKELTQLLEQPGVASSVLELDCEGQKSLAVLRDLQRHPYKPQYLHFDLQRISENEPIVMKIPLRFINGDSAPGVKIGGGLISHLINSVEVSCLPRALPREIVVDLGQMEVGESIHLSNLQLPEAVELVALKHHQDQPVVTLYLPNSEVEEAAEEPTSAEVPVAPKGAAAKEEADK